MSSRDGIPWDTEKNKTGHNAVRLAPEPFALSLSKPVLSLPNGGYPHSAGSGRTVRNEHTKPNNIETGQARATWFSASLLFSVSLCLCGSGFAAPSSPDLPGRLFYTPAQRAQLEAARARNVTRINQATPAAGPPPLRFDGMVIRSDGKTTRWVDGKAEVGASSVTGLKPGQIRANGKVYEPYQVLRPQAPSPVEPAAKETTP